MKWLDHRSRPHAGAVNLTRRAIDSISTALMIPGGSSFSPPKVAMKLEHFFVWPEEAALAVGGEWKLADGVSAVIGYPNGYICHDGWSYADELRNAYGGFVDGWGIISMADVTGETILRRGTENPFPYAFKLSDLQNGLQMRNNSTHPWQGTTITYQDFLDNGYNLPLANGTGAPWVSYSEAGWSGPGVSTIGEEGEGRYLVYPYTWPRDASDIVQNYVGAEFPGYWFGDWEDDWVHAYPGALVEISDGQALGSPDWMRLIPDGATITGARVMISISDIERHTITLESSVEDGNLVVTGSDSEDHEDCGLALLRCTRDGTRYSWGAIAVTPGGPATGGGAMIVDGTGFAAALLGDRSSNSHAYAVVPTPAVQGLASADNRQWLDSLTPSISLGYAATNTQTQPQTVSMRGGEFPGGTYVSASTSRYVKWGAVSIGSFAVDFTVPESEGTRTISAPWPVLGDPSLG